MMSTLPNCLLLQTLLRGYEYDIVVSPSEGQAQGWLQLKCRPCALPMCVQYVVEAAGKIAGGRDSEVLCRRITTGT